MNSGGLCGGESSKDLAMALFTIIVAVAAVLSVMVFAYFAWSAIAALYGDDAFNALKSRKSLDIVKYDCLGGKQYRDSLLDDVEAGK
jgi:hypothetical protein